MLKIRMPVFRMVNACLLIGVKGFGSLEGLHQVIISSKRAALAAAMAHITAQQYNSSKADMHMPIEQRASVVHSNGSQRVRVVQAQIHFP
jgi:hypothetical protein